MKHPERWQRLGVFAAALAYFGLLAPYGLNVGEEGGTVYLIDRTLHGQRPYIDFISGYTPGFFYWHALLLDVFGTNLLVLRAALVLVHAVTVLVLYTLARTLVPPRYAALGAFAYAALLPVVPAVSCSFNVVYPAWYAILLWAVGIHALRRWSADGRAVWLLLAGALAGLNFSFKPNSGLFNLAAAVLSVSFLCNAETQSAPGRPWKTIAANWLVPAAVLGGVAVVFRSHLFGQEGLLLVLPIVALTAVCLLAYPERAVSGHGPGGIAATGSLLAGFAVVSGPWLAYYLWQLGWTRFAREVLFIDAGYEQFFYLAYRPPAWRDAALAAGLAGLVAMAYACSRGRVSGRSLLAGLFALVAGTAAWLGLAAPMPEGFQRSVLMRVQDASFAAAILVHWAAIGCLSAGVADRMDGRPGGAQRRRDLLLLLVAALFLYLTVYPRSDFFHLVFSAPFTLVLAAALSYWLVALWRAGLPVRIGSLLDGTVVAAVAAGLVVIAAPQLALCVDVAMYPFAPERSGLVSVPLKRAPLLVRADGSGQPMRDLAAVVDYLERAQQPGDRLFTFPNLDLLCFLAGLHTPARIGYFYSGWPDHIVEAEVVDALTRQPPRFAVVANPAPLYFSDSPAYFFMLREHIRAGYRPVGRAGTFALLVRAGDAAPPFDAAPQSEVSPSADDPASTVCERRVTDGDSAALGACLAAADARTATALLQRARETDSPEAALALAELFANGQLAASPPAALFALRVVGELGDARAAARLLRAPLPENGPARDAVSTALFNIAIRGLLEPFQFGAASLDVAAASAPVRLASQDVLRQGTAAASGDAGLQLFNVWALRDVLRHWVVSADTDVRLRLFATWALGRDRAGADADRDALLSDLRRLAEDPNSGLQVAAVAALAALDDDAATLERILALVPASPALAPSLALTWSRAHPAAAEPVLLRALREGDPEQREVVAFLAGVLQWQALVPSLREAAAAPQPRVRAAGIWALGRTAGATATATIRAALADPDVVVRGFAAAAMERLQAQAG
ncbi:glycosyltransferase family 39 protein [Candidatus Binatia bacterium]|nr:glycosyltransferase family 39 protein [Candidatus Binatia bacterium]